MFSIGDTVEAIRARCVKSNEPVLARFGVDAAFLSKALGQSNGVIVYSQASMVPGPDVAGTSYLMLACNKNVFIRCIHQVNGGAWRSWQNLLGRVEG
ncbi:hypothetical protein [Caballeronia sp. GAWG1-1]|uniref:hypothetical protein n=1 Tax=Caballeronia sp. GAWG1-1 TaxID=2921742 RepID=UPI002027ECE1|nr:hypothetical protein [Caballeronia sp. GAWG1-1]